MNSPGASHTFRTTQWSAVRLAVGADDAKARVALAELCGVYWYPLYAFIRRSGKSPHDAEDLTQGFFARLVEKGLLASADPAKGKLRTFLLACLQHYLLDEHDRTQAQKRGGGALVNFDSASAEERYAAEPVDEVSPDRLFQRRWALTILEQTLERLGEEMAARGKAELFAALRPFLGFGTGAAKSYEELSPELGIPVGTLKNHVFRLRERWKETLFEEVGGTLRDPTPTDIRGELAELLGCL